MSEIAPNPLVVEIVGRLVEDGRFVTYVESGRLQDVVDVRWAARQAGQLLGQQVRVSSARSEEFEGKLRVTAVMTESEPGHGSGPESDPDDDRRSRPPDDPRRDDFSCAEG